MYDVKKLNKEISKAVELIMKHGEAQPVSQMELTHRCKVSQSGLSACLRGDSGWTISQLATVCNGLHITLEDILLIVMELPVLKGSNVFPRPSLVRGLELGSDERLQVLMDVAYADNRVVAQMFDIETLKKFAPEQYRLYSNCALSDGEMYHIIMKQVICLVDNLRLIAAVSGKVSQFDI